MTINAIRNRRNHGGLSADVVKQTLKFTTNQPIIPFTPTVGKRGKPFIDLDTGEKYYQYSIPATSDPLPAGLVLNQRTGEISGTPTAITLIDETHFSVTVTIIVKDSLLHTAYKKSVLTIVVVDPFVVQEKTLSYDGKVNKLTIDEPAFVSVAGGRPPYVYIITQGTLPPGITIDQTTGKITGTPTDLKRTFISETQVGEIPVEDPIVVKVTDFYETDVTNVTTINFNVEDVILAVPSPNVKIKGPIPLSVYFTAFTSVTLGVEPYVYFTPISQKDPTPSGVVLNSETGVISGLYNGQVEKIVDGIPTIVSEEYRGTLHVAVRDQDDNISSKISKIDIEAFLPLVVQAKEVDEAGAPITIFYMIATKPVNHKPLKALYGDLPYNFTLWFCSYIDKQQNLTQYSTAIPGVEIVSADGTVKADNGLLAGTYIIDFKVGDATGVVLENAPRIMYIVDDAIIATVLTDNTSYELYVNQESNLTVGFVVLRAELGVPPYEFEVTPPLPAGLEMTTTSTMCSIIGTPTKSGKTTCEFSVKDSTGMRAVTKHTIVFNIADRIKASSKPHEILNIIGDDAGTIDIFSSIIGGFPPYSCTLMFGQLPPEYTFKGDEFSYIAGSTPVPVTKPKLWGNEWIETPNGITKGPTKTFQHTGTYISYYTVSDSKGDVSPDRASVKFTVVEEISAVSNNVPKITGLAEITEVNFKPITVTGGEPPYTMRIATSYTDPETKTTIDVPTLGLKTYNPDTIYGVPDKGYQGNMYFYVSDKRGKATRKFPVEFDITSNIVATPYNVVPNIMCVQNTELYEVTHSVNGSRVIETLTSLEIQLFESVTGGTPPYYYFQSNYKGAVVPEANKLPRNFNINSDTGVLTGLASDTEPRDRLGYFCTAADSNNIKDDPMVFMLVVNRPLEVALVDNVVKNPTFRGSDGSLSNTKVVKVIDNLLMSFKFAEGVYGSGRYDYSLSFTRGESSFYQNFKFDPKDGTIAPLDPTMTVKYPGFTKFTVKVRDKFTNIVLEAASSLEIEVYPKITLTRNPLFVDPIKLYRGKIISDENINPIIITGGSGNYVVTTVPELPVGLSMDNKGFLVDAPEHLSTEHTYLVHVDDAVFPGVFGSMSFSMLVQTPYVTFEIPGGSNQQLTIPMLMAKSNFTAVEVENVPMVITINVNGSLTSGSPSSPAFTINWGTIHPETTVLIDLKAGDGIIGAGGAGGTYSASDKLARNGKAGGTGLKLNLGQATATIKGNGRIVGGGGGGGGAGGFDWLSITVMKATRYLANEYLTQSGGFGKPLPPTEYSYDFVYDGTNMPVSNFMYKTEIDRSTNGATRLTDLIWTTSYHYMYSVTKTPGPLDTAKPQTSGKPKPPSTMTGAAGGRGAGSTLGATPGQQGVKSPKQPGAKSVEPTMPSDATFNKQPNAYSGVMGGSFKRPTAVLTIDYAGGLDSGSRSPASDGEGPSAGLGGIEVYSWEGILHGCAGGGGGGFGSKGGDGGVSSPTNAIPPAKPVFVPGGFGGPGGLAIDASDCFIAPIIVPETKVYGEIKTFVDDPNNTGPQ